MNTTQPTPETDELAPRIAVACINHKEDAAQLDTICPICLMRDKNRAEKDLADTKARIAELQTSAEKADRELTIERKKNESSLAHNLCPDHRDKQQGKSCLACEIERLARLRAATPDVEALLNECARLWERGVQPATWDSFSTIIRRHFANAPDATGALRKERDELRADLQAAQYEQAMTQVKLDAAEKDAENWKERAALVAEEREYHMNHINRLEKALGLCAETTETVINAAIAVKAERDQLRAALEWIATYPQATATSMRERARLAIKPGPSDPSQPAPAPSNPAQGAASQSSPDQAWINQTGEYAWHNPANLTREQIGTGYRPLTAEEAKCVPGPAEVFNAYGEHIWEPSTSIGYCGREDCTYRIPLNPTPPQPDAGPGQAKTCPDCGRQPDKYGDCQHSDTQETDAEEVKLKSRGNWYGEIAVVGSDFSRRLERERNEARRKVKCVNECRDRDLREMKRHEHSLIADLSAAQARAAQAEAELAKLRQPVIQKP